MRTALMILAGVAALAVCGPAAAQSMMHGDAGHDRGASADRRWAGGEHRWSAGQHRWSGSANYHRDWGGSIGGRWIAGARAPGGWDGYRRPVRGWAMPNYWLSPDFYMTDWAAYGLAAPPYGYHWSRYYDDAVLVDQYGRVMDWNDDIDWSGQDGGYADRGDYRYDYSHDAGPGAGYPPPPYGGDTCGMHNACALPPPPPPEVTVTHGPGCGCSYGGYYYPPSTTTTVTVASMPVTTTTTTTSYVEERARTVVVHRGTVHHWHPAPQPHHRSKLLRRKLRRR